MDMIDIGAMRAEVERLRGVHAAAEQKWRECQRAAGEAGREEDRCQQAVWQAEDRVARAEGIAAEVAGAGA